MLCMFIVHGQPVFCLEQDILFVQIPNVKFGAGISVGTREGYVDGCRIMRLDRDGKLSNLTAEFTSACDPAVDFDGKTIYFTGKRLPGDHWSLWKMNADGSQKKMVPTGVTHSVSPLPVGSLFHLNDDHPAPRLVFVGADEGWLDPILKKSFSLYACWMDGSGVQRITHNTDADFGPTVLPNGRVVYSSIQDVGDKSLNWKLMAVNIDGADAMQYYGRETASFLLLQPAASPDGRLYFVESGSLAFVKQGRPQHSYQKLASGWFQTPCPLNEKSLLVSTQSSAGDVFSLVQLSAETGAVQETVYRDRDFQCVDAQVLAPHERVDGRSSVVNMEKTFGVLYCLNVYESQHGQVCAMAPSGAKAVRVFEGRNGSRLLGDAPIQEDGSFHLRVPADAPLRLQLLDESGEAIRTQCGAMWVRPGERRGCIGCHEDPELAPPNRLAQAVIQPAFDLTLMAEKKANIDFEHNIAPILADRCSECHDASHRLNFQMDPNSDNNHIAAIYNKMRRYGYVKPGSALTSPMIKGMRGKPHSLSDDTVQTFVDWINQGAPYSIQAGELR